MKNLKTLLAALLILMAFSCDDSPSDGDPEEGIPLKFFPKTEQDQMGDFAENAMVVFDGKVWSYGGVNSYGASGSHFGWSSNNGINWAALSMTPNALTAPRIAHTLTVFDGKMWLIGGENSSHDFQSDVWNSTNGTDWTEVVPTTGFGAIAYHSTVVFHDRIYVIAPDLANNTTSVWSTSNGTEWQNDAPSAFPLRGQFKAVVFNDAIYVIGGRDVAGFRTDKIWKSNDGEAWEQVTTSSPSFAARSWHTATVYNNKVFIIGGYDETTHYYKDIWYSTSMIDWTKYNDPLAIEGVNRHSALVYDDEIYVFGGYKASGTSGKIYSIKEIL